MTYAEWVERGPNIERLVLHFWAEWNNYDCKTDHELQKVFDAFHIDIEWRSYDTEQQQGKDWLLSTGLRTVPSVAGFRFGKLVGMKQGFQFEHEYRLLLKEWFRACPPD